MLPPPPPDGAGSPPFVKTIGKGVYVIDQKALQQVLDNPNQIMTDAWLSPHIVDNKQEGFVLKQIKKNGLYDSLGLKNGDVLLRINDYSIANPVNTLQAFTALRGMDRIQLDIIRDGAKTTMTYQIR
jgi:general secretion pathway protein C